MKLYQNLFYIVALCFLVFVLLTHQTNGQTITNIEQQTTTTTTTSTESESLSSTPHRGIFDMIISPLRKTFQRARRMITERLGGARNIVADGFDDLQAQTFNIFMRLYNRTYAPEEIPKRMQLFFERRHELQQAMRDYAAGKLSFMVRENNFVDWDQQELKTLKSLTPPKSRDELTSDEREALIREEERLKSEHGEELNKDSHWVDGPIVESSQYNRINNNNNDDDDNNMLVQAPERIPATKDWRTSGCVSTPINQLKCGACYAIATMGALESMRCINKVSSPILSSQQVVDCSSSYSNYGCDGGWPTRVLKYLQNTGVAARETCYPFVRRQMSCRLRSVKAIDGCTVAASPSDTSLRYKVLNNERDILYHVAKTGPVITVLRATDPFLFYSSGIFDDPKCSRKRDDVDHAIVIVGYGRENGKDYWLIKNSWGTEDWGEEGYGKVKRGSNACSIGHWGWVVTS